MSRTSRHAHIAHPMNWRLIFCLSLLGLIMGVGTVFFISSNIEPYLWIIVFLISAFLIARHCPYHRFLHGLIIGVANSIWITATHILFFSLYMAGHPREAAMLKSLPNVPRIMMMVTGPVVGIMSGIIIGALALVAGHFVTPAGARRPAPSL